MQYNSLTLTKIISKQNSFLQSNELDKTDIKRTVTMSSGLQRIKNNRSPASNKSWEMEKIPLVTTNNGRDEDESA